MAPGVAQRVLQVHATRRCNLRCLHCYSASGPDQREQLPTSVLYPAIEAAAAQGYTIAGFSGGEPAMDPYLSRHITHAKRCGFYTTVTTNGMLLEESLLHALTPALDLLAISLDGVKASHERIRGSPRAFDAMLSRLPLVRAAGIPFGFIFTLTQHNVHELEAVAAFAADQGARLLTIHPLEIVGRAAEQFSDGRPDGIELAAGLIEARRLAGVHADRMLIRLDVFDRVTLRRHPDLVYADDDEAPLDVPLAELVAPLVIEPDGWVVPLEYGFPRALSLGSLHASSLDVLARGWRTTGYAAFRNHCRAIFQAEQMRSTLPTDRLFNWYEAVLGGPASTA